MNTLLRGAIAGAAGTIALDVTTYADMAMRGRASSNTPAEVIRKLAEKSGASDLATPDAESSDETKNRRSALGALSGYLVGIGVGALYGAMRARTKKMPALLAGSLAGAAAMAASDVPATRLKATNPKEWGAAGWAADIIPHAIYGTVTALVYDSLSTRDGKK